MMKAPIRAGVQDDAISSWMTPQWLVQRIRDDVFGGEIDLDPATCDSNPVGATRFYTPKDDGLICPWDAAQRIFVNPPFILAAKFAEKALFESAKDADLKIVFLGPAAVGTAWLHHLWENARDAVFLRKRISFEGVSKGSPTRGTVLFSIGSSLKGIADLGTRAPATLTGKLASMFTDDPA